MTGADVVGAPDKSKLKGASPGASMAVLFLVMAFNYMDRAVISVLLEPISRDLALSDSALGLLAGLPFAVLYALMGLPFARVADVGNRTTLIAAAVATWSLATAACGLAMGFTSLFLLRVLVGIGEGAGTPATHSALADNLPNEKRAFGAGLFVVAAAVGQLFGMAGGGLVADHFGWRVAFAVIGLPGLIVAALVLWLVPERRTAPRWPRLNEVFGSEAIAVLARIGARPTFPLLVVGFTLLYLMQNGVVQWSAVLVVRQLGLTMTEVGLGLGLASALPGLVGGFLGGLLGSAMSKRHISWLLIIPAICTLLIFPATLLFVVSEVWVVSLAAMAAMAFVGSLAMGPLFAGIYCLASSNERATVVALVAVFTNVVGAGGGPFLVGALSDLLSGASGADALRNACALVSALALPAALLLYLAARRLNSDAIQES
jgi:MFS family permease